ncbi:MAG: SPOR domain-containing protein [Gammaproteobacteria bacterium]
MPRDYARTPKPKDNPGLPGWAWLLAGLAIGLFVALLVYLDRATPATDKSSVTSTIKKHWNEARDVRQQEQAAPPPKPDDGKTMSKPRFDFYTILPELEVAIPELELLSDRKKTAAGSSDNTQYILQAGSFKQHDEADKLKALLALQGIVASIQTVRIGDGETWHRVRVGPLQGLDNLNQTRQRLQQLGVATIVVKNKT